MMGSAATSHGRTQDAQAKGSRLLAAVTSLLGTGRGHMGSVVATRRLWSTGSIAGTQAWLFCCMWSCPRPGIEPGSPALAGGFFTPEPPRKPCCGSLNFKHMLTSLHFCSPPLIPTVTFLTAPLTSLVYPLTACCG